MESKHTPGPWIVCTVDGEDSILNIEQDRDAINEEPSIVASVDLSGDGIDEDVGRANARLIAAAPELYEALKALYEHCVMLHKYWGPDGNCERASAAEAAGIAAIAKAEGRA